MFSTYLAEIILKYLNWQLDRGHHQHVHTISSYLLGKELVDYFAGKGIVLICGSVSHAAWLIQERLYQEFGYQLYPFFESNQTDEEDPEYELVCCSGCGGGRFYALDKSEYVLCSICQYDEALDEYRRNLKEHKAFKKLCQ